MIKNKLNSLKIGQKMCSIVIFAVVAPFLVLSFFLADNIYDATLAQTIQKKQSEISRIEPLVNQVISDMVSECNRIQTDGFYRQLCTASGELSSSFLESEAAISFFQELRETQAVDDNPFTVRIYANLPETDDIFSASISRDILLPMDRIRGSYWHGIFAGSNCRELFCPSFYLSNWEKEKLGDLSYVTPFYCNANGIRTKCYLCIYCSSSILKNILTDISEKDGTVSYLITDRDAIVTSTNDNLSGIYHFDYEDIYQNMFSSNNYMQKYILGQKVYLSFKTIQKPSWFLINVVPDSVIREETKTVLYYYIFITAVVLVTSIVITTRLSSSLAGRISNVIFTMSRIREGSLVPMEEPEIRDEIGDLISTYNYMTARQKALTDDLKQTADELRVAEVNALQAQINPHFLYNTLDTIQWMAIGGKDNDVISAVQNLSRFYKLTLGRDMTNTTIEKEIEHASIYVDLQNMRFDDAIQFIVDIPEELLPLKIPRLTLQPIVENAILHGIREKESQEGCIVITGWLDEEDICLLISDDGVGIEETVLPKILSEAGINPTTQGTNIAIYNVHHRLQLLYGADYGLSYESKIGVGTEVMIRFPNRQ